MRLTLSFTWLTLDFEEKNKTYTIIKLRLLSLIKLKIEFLSHNFKFGVEISEIKICKLNLKN